LDLLIEYGLVSLAILLGLIGVILMVSLFRRPKVPKGETESPASSTSGATPAPIEPAHPESTPPGESIQPAGELATEPLEPTVSPGLDVAALSDLGQVRELNEDCLLTLDLFAVRQSMPLSAHLLAVADGLGGHLAGEVASAMAVRVLAEEVSRGLLDVPGEADQASLPDYPSLLSRAVQQANVVVHNAAQGNRSGMGTTLVAALVIDNHAYLANVGDSRAYLVSQTEIRRITVDHSLVERLVATGQITRQEARHHPERHLIYRSLGLSPEVEVDTFSESPEPGQWLLLCSDGLSSMVKDTDIHTAIVTAPNAQAAATALVAQANAAGGEDNVTVVVARWLTVPLICR
jgi:serine/threonine protein phosphatase PrpC